MCWGDARKLVDMDENDWGDKQEGRLQCEKVRDIMGDLFTDAPQ